MFLLDTDILIYSLKGTEKVVRNLEKHQQDYLCISVVSLMELYYGAFKSEKKIANLAKARRIEENFALIPEKVASSPLDVPSIKAEITTQEPCRVLGRQFLNPYSLEQ